MSGENQKAGAKQAHLFEKYIQARRILIADPSAVSRSTIAKLLVGMGAKTANIALATNYAGAQEEIGRAKPQVVICDYNLGKRCGLDLLQEQRLHRPESKDCLFIMVTGNTSQTSVARAAEEDVDSYILKPFTSDVLRLSILRAAVTKMHPSDYLQAIETGKAQLAEGKIDEAAATFEGAKKLDPSPALACFYLGQAHLIKQALDQAKVRYTDGLSFNKIHYKCMVGLYEVLMSMKMHADAYEVIKRISHYFPANPQRLTSVLRLAVMTGSFEDIERYYQIFTCIDERHEDLIRYVCAALVVCGRHYLQQNLNSRAIELFQKAATAAAGRARMLREIVQTLVEHGLVKQAGEFLAKFPADTRSGADFLAAELVVAAEGEPRSRVIDRGRTLLGRDIHDPGIYQILIRCSSESGLLHAAEDLVREAVQRWPDQAETFNRAMQVKAAAAKQA